MSEYLAPGVYVEETSFRSRSIEGVSTSIAGFVGPTQYGPISGELELLTSFSDFERIYGGMYELNFLDKSTTTNYMAYAVRAFFEEGGQMLYVSRVFSFANGPLEVDAVSGIPQQSYSIWPLPSSPPASTPLRLVARFPGAAGNIRADFTLRVGANAFQANPPNGSGPLLTRVQSFDVVHISTPIVNSPPTSPPASGTPNLQAFGSGDGLYVAEWDRVQRQWEFYDGTGGKPLSLVDLHLPPNALVRPVTVLVEVELPNVSTLGVPGFDPPQSLGEFSLDGRSINGLTNTFTRQPSTRNQALTIPFSIERVGGFDGVNPEQLTLEIARDLLGSIALETLSTTTPKTADRRTTLTLQGGDDGNLPQPTDYVGDQPDFQDFINDHLQMPKRGLVAFESVDDISIVAAPGYSDSVHRSMDDIHSIHGALLDHCENMRYRVAVLDMPPSSLVSDALDFRNQRSSNYGALYYPWITIVDPLTDTRLNLPPSGFVSGIYARSDTEHAVFKAPANEVVRLAIDFEQRLNKAQQEVLNPEGINCFRYFPGNGFLLWGARTISEDSDWKYVSVRRYFAYLEHSIDKGTQWVVFENNGPQLWLNVRHTIEDFLLNEWKSGGLLGSKPEQAYFVRCDLSTMTQNDLDNGRLVCLIGVAPVKPAEFVIFRIGQWTTGTTA